MTEAAPETAADVVHCGEHGDGHATRGITIARAEELTVTLLGQLGATRA